MSPTDDLDIGIDRCRVEGQDPAGEVLAVPSFASLWLMPRLPSFRSQHPAMRVHLTASYGEADFSRGAVDVHIRYGPVNGRDLHVESVFSEEILPLVSPRMKVALNIRAPEDLVSQELIQSELTMIQWPHWSAAHGVPVSPSDYVLSFDRTSMGASEGALRRGDLVPVFDDRKGMPVRAHHLVYPRAHAQWERVDRLSQWLRAEVSRS